MEHRFYQLSRKPLEMAVAQLSEKVVARGQNLSIHAPSVERVKGIDDALWTYLEFMPHAVEKQDGVSKILITTSATSNADVQFWLDDFNGETLQQSLICNLFQSVDQDIVASRRADWKRQNDAGVHLTYWSEDESGRWKISAEANKP